MDIGIIVTGIVGLLTTAGSSVVTFLLSRKKYNVGVDHDTIENLQNALKFYEEVVESNNKTLTDLLTRSEQLSKTNVELLVEVQNLKIQVQLLASIINSELKNVDLEKYGVEIQGGEVTKTKKLKNRRKHE